MVRISVSTEVRLGFWIKFSTCKIEVGISGSTEERLGIPGSTEVRLGFWRKFGSYKIEVEITLLIMVCMKPTLAMTASSMTKR